LGVMPNEVRTLANREGGNEHTPPIIPALELGFYLAALLAL